MRITEMQIQQRLFAAVFDETPLFTLGLSQRPHNALHCAGIWTVERLTDMTLDEVLEVRNVGMKSLDEIAGTLQNSGW